jgi:signal transduction histidine kinase
VVDTVRELGWSIALSVPATQVKGPLSRSLPYVIGAAVISLLGGLALGAIFARRIAEPVQALSESAKALGEGRPLPPPAALAIVELDTVDQDLQRAADLLRERARERDRVEAELRDRDEFLHEQAELLRQSEERLRRQADELEQQLLASGRLVAVGELTASMAHEFNNPLGIILGFAQGMLAEMDPNDPNYRHVEIIAEETQRCEKLVQDLLEFGRPRSAEFAPVEVRPIVERTFDLVSSRAAKNNVQTEAQIADALPPIHADARQIQQLLLNLSLNAIDAMPRGGTLAVGAAPDDGAVVISVRDTGIGIESDMIRKIFQPFVTANKRRGLGLGLPICDRIAKTHRGTIEVKSQPGAGTTFTIRLPITRESASSDLSEAK